jgi:hypothetical protein
MTGNQTSQARHIVDRLGGRSEASRITGYPLTKIDSMIRTGWVAGKDQAHILLSAWAASIPMNELDFVVHLRALRPPVATPERTAAVG